MLATMLLYFVMVILLFVIIIYRRKQRNYPPGPFPWPLIGNQFLLRRLTRKFGCQHLVFEELSRMYRTNVVALKLGMSEIVIVSGRKLTHKVLHCEDYDGRPWNEFIKLRNMGMRKGITMNDGAEWKQARGWLVRVFRSVGFGQQRMVELIKNEVTMVLDNLKNGGVHCLKKVLTPAVINVLWTLTTGQRLGQNFRLQHFMELMERRTRCFDMSGGILSTFPWIRYIAPELSGYNLLVTINKELRALLMDAIEEHEKVYTPGKENDLIDMFLREMHNEKDLSHVFTNDQLMIILLDLFIAGAQTTTTTLDFLFINMAIHPDVQRKLHEEIDAVIGPDRSPDLTDRPSLPYTEAVLTEVQRLWVVTPIIGPRRVLRDTVLMDYTIPKDTCILLNLHSVNTDPELYPEPEEFKPDRFLKDNVYQTDDNVILFGKGKRRCPGEVLAKSALFLIFVSIMQKFEVLPVPGQGPSSMEIVPGLTISPKPYEVLLVPR